MAWTTPTVRATGYLVTASDWNTDIVNNLAYLKGEAGLDIELEDDVIPSAGTERVGLSTAPWDEGHFDKLFAGPRYTLHRFIRRQNIPLTQQDFGTVASDYQIGQETHGTGALGRGGTNQAVLAVTENGAGDSMLYNEAEQNNAQDTSFNTGRNPYLRAEFAVNRPSGSNEVFIGFRTTRNGAARPLPAAESYACFMFTGAIWVFECGDASGNQDTSGSQTITADTRYVVEILIIGGTSVECYLNGVLVDTLTTGLPTGDLDWQILLLTDGSGGANVARLTCCDPEFQEDLS